MISKSFLKSSLIYTAGSSLPIVASLILLPFYTNYLNDLQFTQITFYISISLLFQILFSYSIESYFGIKYTQLSGNQHEQKRFVGTTSFLLLIIGAGLILITALCGNSVFKHVFNPSFEITFWPYGFYSILTAFFNSYFKTSTNCLIYFKKPGLFLTVNVINASATLLISIGGLFLFPDSIIGPIYGRLLSGLIIFFLAQYVFTSNGEFVFDKKLAKDIQTFCTPYIFYVISIWILGQLDRYVLQTYVPNTEINTYDLILKCFFGIEFIQNGLSAIIFPKLYEIWNSQGNQPLRTTKESNRYFNVFTAINIIQLILFCIIIPLIYKLFINNPSFYESDKYIGLLAAGYSIRSITNFYLSTILFTKSTYTLLKIYGISALLHILLIYFSIRHFGLPGAIYAGITIKAIQALLSVAFTRNIFIYEYNYFKIIIIPLVYILINIVQFNLLTDYTMSYYLLQLGLFAVIFFFAFKNEIKIVVNQYIKK